MKCLKKIAIFSLVFFVSLFFIMPVQAKSTQTYSIIYDLQDASGNKIAQVKYKNKDFTSEIGSEIKVRTTYFDKKYGDFDLVSEQSQKVEAGKDQYIFVYRTYQPITIKGKVQFTTKGRNDSFYKILLILIHQQQLKTLKYMLCLIVIQLVM